MRRILLTVLAGLVLVAVLPDAASADTVPRAERVLVFSVPTLSWAEANDFDLPHLSAQASRAGNVRAMNKHKAKEALKEKDRSALEEAQ